MYKILTISLLAVAVAPLYAQNAEQRAADIKEWRAKCNDPDPDLRLGFFEAALETGDRTIQRVCLRQTLASDEVEVQDLGLRAALAMTDRISFELSEPPELSAARAAAEGNPSKTKAMETEFRSIIRFMDALGYQLILTKIHGEISSASSTWHTYGGNNKPMDSATVTAMVSGPTVSIDGILHYGGSRQIKIALRLNDEGALAGTLRSGVGAPIPVTLRLL